MVGDSVHVYFHSPCFDGLVSAVLLVDHFRSTGSTTIQVHPVNYHLNETWEHYQLLQPAAVVDFMYHPDAAVWFDHHSTAFLTKKFEEHFLARRDSLIVYDARATSCAVLIWKTPGLRISGEHETKVLEADRIDSARYDTPFEAVYGDTPSMRINASFAVGETQHYSSELVRLLIDRSLEEVAQQAEVRSRYQEFARLRDLGMRAFKPTAHLQHSDGYLLDENGLLLFSVDSTQSIISRYAPFAVEPRANYSLGVVRSGNEAKITAMRNPWREFESVELGQIFQKFGGGGHARVASTRRHGRSRRELIETLFEVRDAMESAIRHQARGAPA